jgi:hypothetical protein
MLAVHFCDQLMTQCNRDRVVLAVLVLAGRQIHSFAYLCDIMFVTDQFSYAVHFHHQFHLVCGHFIQLSYEQA